jgi:hypothetical protein
MKPEVVIIDLIEKWQNAADDPTDQDAETKGFGF